MALAAQAGQVEQKAPISSEEKLVIVASSVGTVFEWYDFYLYATLAPFFAALFFPKGNATAALLSAFAAYAAGFLVRPFGALVFGRIGDLIGRKYTFLVTILVMGVSTFLVGLPPDLRGHRLVRADHPRDAAPAAGPRARRRVRRRRDLRGRALAPGQPRLQHELDPDHRDGRLLPRAARDRRVPLDDGLRLFADLGMAHRLPDLDRPARLLGLHPAQAAGVAGLPEDEGGGEGLQGAPHRQLPPLSEQQVRVARAVRRDRRPGRGLVHGPVLRAVLPHDHARSSTT